jgi:PAS domain S-box-containing protein
MTEFSARHDDPFAPHLAALAVLDDRGTVVGWNRRAEELLGHPSEAVIGRAAFDALVDPPDLPTVRQAAASCRRTGGWVGQLKLRHRDGRLVEVGLRAHAFARDDRVREWLVAGVLAADVLEWQRDRAVLDGLYRRCPIGLVVHGPDLRVLRVNRAIERFTGVPAADFRGLPTGHLLLPDDARRAVDRVRQVLETGRALGVQHRVDRQRTGHQRLPVRRWPSDPAADP